MIIATETSPAGTAPVPAAIDIVRGGDADEDAWNAYVDRHRDGTFFHLFGWGKVIQNSYNYEPLYLIAKCGGRITGVLLLIDARSPLLGRALISTAFTIGGGILADDSETIAALARHASALGQERRVNYIELRSEAAPSGWVAKSDKYAGFTSTMPRDEKEHFALIPKKRRAEIRKALKGAEDGLLNVYYTQDLDIFYRLYARSLRNHGTPVFPRRYLEELINAFQSKTDVTIVDYDGAPAVALLSFYYKNAVMPYYIGADANARQTRSLDFIYWTLMRHAVSRGCDIFDFGRSKIDSGPYLFKTLWGFDATPLIYHYKLIGAAAMPDVNPNNWKFKYFTQLWQRLPVPVANLAGPLLASNFP